MSHTVITKTSIFLFVLCGWMLISGLPRPSWAGEARDQYRDAVAALTAADSELGRAISEGLIVLYQDKNTVEWRLTPLAHADPVLGEFIRQYNVNRQIWFEGRTTRTGQNLTQVRGDYYQQERERWKTTRASEPAGTASPPHSETIDPSVPLSPAAWNQLSRNIQGPLLAEPITFEPGEKELSDDTRRLILEGVQKLPNYSPHIRLLVEAHVDKGTSPLDDQKLSDERALAVKQFLTAECRISPERIFLRPCGSNQPPEQQTGESKRAYQRRARSVWILLVNE